MNRSLLVRSIQWGVALLTIAVVPSPSARGAAGSPDWDALTPGRLKSPEPVDLPQNPLQPACTPAVSRPPAGPGASAAPRALLDFARSHIQGVVRNPGSGSLLVWGNRLYAPGQALRSTEAGAGAEYLILLKTVENHSVVLVARPAADPEGTPVEVRIPLPPFFRVR